MSTGFELPPAAIDFRDQRILVTGGTRGIGAAIVQRFVQGGVSVATTGRSVPRDGDGPARFVQADVSTTKGVREVAEMVLAEWGGVDVLVNCVGAPMRPAAGSPRSTTQPGSARSSST